MGKVVDIWRMEHVTCSYGKDLLGVHHGPYRHFGCPTAYSGKRPNFGTAGLSPNYINEKAICGVTRRQYNDWWDQMDAATFHIHKKAWGDAGWAFVLYKLPKTRVRWDNNQVIFIPGNMLHRSVIPWSELPKPYVHNRAW